MIRRWTRYALTLLLAGSLILTLVSAVRIGLDPTLRPVRDAAASEITAAVDRELARLSPGAIPARITALLAAEPRDWVVLEALRGLAEELGQPLPVEVEAAYQAAFEADSGFFAAAQNCAACAADLGACSLSTVFICGVPVELSFIGDVRDITKGAIDYMAGNEVDRVAVALSIVGIGATVAVVVSGGTSVSAKLGASALKIARGMGRVSPRLNALMARAAADGIDWLALRRARGFDDIAASLRAEAFAPLVSIAADLERMRGATNVTTALHLLPMVDDANDARRLANATEALGPRVVARAEVLGKARLLRATVRVTGMGYALIAGMVGLIMSLAVMVAGWLQSRLFAALRRSALSSEDQS